MKIETFGNATLYLGDCREILPTLGKVDAVVTDPPYNSGIKYGAKTDDNREDYWEWLGERIAIFIEAAPTVLIKHSALKQSEFLSRWPARTLIWIKPFSSGFPFNGVATHWEPVHWLTGKSKSWSKDYFECSAGSSNREVFTGHPAQMPEALVEWLVSTFTNFGQTILDPFMGSGTTGVACLKLGRHFIGVEIEPKYFDIACRRIEKESKNQYLFEQPKKTEQALLFDVGKKKRVKA